MKGDDFLLKKYCDVFFRAVITGVAIGLGGTVYLSCENKYLGAFLFGTGLFVILTFNFSLFTGKVGYLIVNKITYIPKLAVVWIGNLIGTVIMGVMILHTRISRGIAQKAEDICKIKFSDNLISIFILAFFCGILMFIAAEGYKRIVNPLGQILIIFLPVVLFILSGYEHCIANMFYFTVSDNWSPKTVIYLLVMTMGNSFGGMVIPFIQRFLVHEKAK